MGEVAEMILDGTLCQSCGVFIGEGEGFPRECAYCRRAGKAAGKVACPVCKKKVKGLNDHIRDAHPGHTEREKATHETATRDMLDSARADLEMLREALGVPAEPHQSLIERMVEAAQAKRGAVPVYCTPTEHEGRIVYEHTSEPIPNADGFVLYAAPDHFRNAAEMVAEPANDAVRLQPYGRHCQNGGDVCLASRSDGIVCPDDSCDIDARVRIAPAPAEVPSQHAGARTGLTPAGSKGGAV